MLRQLDVLIGFAVVMTIVSVLITIVTQIISTTLGLRGKNLADALEVMMHKIDPSINQQVNNLAKQLSNRVLTHPVISDSILSMRTNIFDRIPILSALRRRWKIASAIRADELLAILQDIAGASPYMAAAVVQQKDIMHLGERAAETMRDPDKRLRVFTDIIGETKRIYDAHQQAAQLAREATEKAEFEGPAMSREAAQKAELAQKAANLAEYARLTFERVEATLQDETKAQEFAKDAPLRGAALKLLAKLYVPRQGAADPKADFSVHSAGMTTGVTGSL